MYCDINYLTGIIIKSLKNAEDDPETALIYARKSVEGICANIFYTEIGDPGNNRLDKLIEILSSQKKIPQEIIITLRVIQQYGNYGSHIQYNQAEFKREFAEPCLRALIQISTWYFLNKLEKPIPDEIVFLTNEYIGPKEDVRKGFSEELTSEISLPAQLRQYQWEGVSFLLNR